MLEEIFTFDNLYQALKDSCSNVRWKDSVISYESNGLKNTLKLQKELLNGTYKPRKYVEKIVYEPKKRKILCVALRDRQVQHCLCDNYLYDELTKHFIYDNFAGQYRKGNHKFVKRVTHHLSNYYRENKTNEGYALTCDIQKFFQSIPHSVVKKLIRKYINEPDVIKLLDLIIDSYAGDFGFDPGAHVIQLLALAVLNPMDHIIKEKLHIKYYIRYNDDFVLIHKSKSYLKHCLSVIRIHLKNIGLTLKERKTKIIRLSNGFKILHWRFKLTKSGKVLRLAEKTKLGRFRRKYTKMIKLHRNVKTLNDYRRSFRDDLKLGNTRFIIQRVENFTKEMEKTYESTFRNSISFC